MMLDGADWRAQLQAQREEKDNFFALHVQSPISRSQRRHFTGLAYFPVEPAYRYELELHEHQPKEATELADTGGNVRRLVRWGEFRFELEGQHCTLQAYKDDPEDERLFVPFRDETSGKETYGAGRYLDLESHRHLTAEGTWIVDFNEAYNPWCAYSEEYVCPFVPPENWLNVPVRAGEKKYPLGQEHRGT